MLIRNKIVFSSVGGLLLAVGAMVVVLKAQQSKLASEVYHQAGLSAEEETESIARGVHHMVHAQNQLLQEGVKADLNVARDMIERAGGVRLDAGATTTWTAVNQYTKDKAEVHLPAMRIGEARVVPNLSFDVQTPIVDETQRLVGGTATIFQRMNEQGDMLRVATNVRKLDDNRAVGTFIPARNPDGKPNPVVSTVMGGETFYGRAFVVNAWYITVYEPIIDSDGDVVGVLYAGVKQESVDSLRNGILDTVVGQTGGVSVLGATGKNRGEYFVSSSERLNGTNVWGQVDADGEPYVQRIIEGVAGAGHGEAFHERYALADPKTGESRTVVASAVYYQPWDWVIVASTFEDEYFGSVESTNAAASRMVLAVIAIGVGACVLSAAWIYVAAMKITRPIVSMTRTLEDLAEGDGDLTHQVEVKSRDELAQMASGFNRFIDKIHDLVFDVRHASIEVASTAEQINNATREVASQTEEQNSQTVQIAAAVEQMSCSVEDIAKQSSQAATQAGDSGDEAQRGGEIVSQTINGMREIAEVVNASGDSIRDLGERTRQIDEVISVINDIADQTNLLALNAAIEAARAGEHGRGFAVVADEVRKLADRTTGATKEISESISGIQEETLAVVEQMSLGTQRVEEGVELAGRAGEALSSIQDVVHSVSGAIQSIAAAGNEQSAASADIASSVDMLRESATRTAETTTQASSAVQTLASRATQLQDLVSRFKLRD